MPAMKKNITTKVMFQATAAPVRPYRGVKTRKELKPANVPSMPPPTATSGCPTATANGCPHTNGAQITTQISITKTSDGSWS